MKLGHTTTDLTVIDEVEIPDKFYNRMDSGIKQINDLFGGNGILPGSTATVAAKPGTGKTSLFLGVLSSLAEMGHDVAYITAEEALTQLAFTAQRLNAKGFLAAAKTGVTEIVELAKEVDFMVIDSFQGIENDTNEQMSARKFEEYVTSQVVRAAQQFDTTIVLILHMTKTGEYKGGANLAHAVDMNIKIAVDPNAEDRRVIWTEKNRFGALHEVTTYFGYNGYDFDRTVTPEEIAESKRQAKITDEMKQVITAIEVNGPMPKAGIQIETGLSESKIQQLTYKLQKMGELVSDGSKPATYSLAKTEA